MNPARQFLAISLLFLAAQVDARDRIRIVGSEAALEYTQPVAEQFARHWGQPNPSLEVTGAAVGYRLFCAGIGYDHPDIAVAARPMTKAERSVCAKRGVTDISEIEFGRDAIVLAYAGKTAAIPLSRAQLFAALAREVPAGESLVENRAEYWSDIDSALPKTRILVMAPEPNTIAAISFQEHILAEGCKAFPAILRLPEVELQRTCRSLRQDGHVVNAAKLEESVVAWLEENENAYAAIDYTTYKHFAARTAVNPIDGIQPSDTSIRNGSYPSNTGFHVYVKGQHAKALGMLQQFLYEMTSERALGPEGYLADRGLVPLDDSGRNKARDEALRFGM